MVIMCCIIWSVEEGETPLQSDKKSFVFNFAYCGPLFCKQTCPKGCFYLVYYAVTPIYGPTGRTHDMNFKINLKQAQQTLGN